MVNEYCVWVDPETRNAVAFKIGLVGDEMAATKFRIRHENTVYYVMSKGIMSPELARATVHALVAGRGITRTFQDIWDKGY